jgi:hypothetical protein
MTQTHCWDNAKPDLQQAAETACHTAENVLKVALDCHPLLNEMSELQKVYAPQGRCDPERLKIEIQAIDDKLHRYGLLPHLHIGCDDNSNPTLVLDPADSKTDCFGYMHVPNLGYGQMLGHGREDVSRGHRESVDMVMRDANEAVDRVFNGVGDVVKNAGCSTDPRI